MQHLLRNKIIHTIIFVALMPHFAFSQERDNINLEDHDDKAFHFGIYLGANRAHYNFTHHPTFLHQVEDSILSIESINSTGINLGWLVNMRLGEHFDLRTYPLNLVFTEKAFQYHLSKPDILNGETSTMTKKVQGITLSLPVQIKFTSDRIYNFKVYMMAGGKAEYDFAANAGDKKAEDLIKLSKLDYGIEAGVGSPGTELEFAL